ncbi:hypothetical protein C2845_PM05G27020 [Panicum miliaceum]|uniref:Uncharacterized protein n=1 Tax=Panicum miliaceum TaxID=4540 RepID=A0A3L6T194_PANMI|nr:hypothetical protein C2845_PM05G27020 [Panicum miliaceum]
MANTSSSFSDMLNSAISSGEPQNQIEHHFPPTQNPMNYPPPQFSPNFNPQYSHPFNPYGGQSSFTFNPFTQGSYQGAYQGMRQQQQQQQGGGQATPVGSTTFFQGSDSQADESSPVGSASPVSQEQLRREDPVDTADWSERVKKSIAAEKMAEATLTKAQAAQAKAEADSKMAEDEKEKTKLQ